MNLVSYEALLAWRNKFVHITFGLGLLFVVLVRFVIPETIGHDELVLLDQTQSSSFAPILAQAPEGTVAADADAWRTQVADSGALGLSVTGSPEDPGATYLVRGHEGEKQRALMETAAFGTWQPMLPESARAHSLTSLRGAVPPTPINKQMIPIMLTLDVVFLGFMFASAMMLEQKTSGTIRAFRVSPSTTFDFIVSKIIVNVAMAWGYGLLLMLGGGVRAYPIPEFLVMLTMATTAFTCLGLFIATFYDNLSGMFVPLMITGMALAIPIGGVFSPTSTPEIVQLIPSYRIVATFNELLFPTGRDGFMWRALGELAIPTVSFTVMAWVAIDRRLMKEAV